MHTRAGRPRYALLAALALFAMALFAMAAVAPPARADLTAQELTRARQQLQAYDVHGGTVAVLSDLSRFIEGAEGADLREARFLRAAAATDLVLLSMGGTTPTLRAEVASALGVSEPELVPWLQQELQRVSFGVYQPVAEESRWALDVIESGEVDPHVLHDGHGERRDMLYVHAVVDALGREGDIERLAEFGADPCAEADATSGAPCDLSMFAPSGRRAVDALREASRALTRLERIAASGEPLMGSLAGIVAADGAILRTTEIHPTPAFAEGLAIRGVGSRGVAAHPELLVVVEPGRVRYAYVPAARVVGERVVVTTAGEPTLPRWASFDVRDDHRAAVVPYEDVTAHFAALQRQRPHGTVGVASSGEVTGIEMSRILVSLERAGLPTPTLVARGLEGEARELHIRLVGEDEGAPASVYIRLGGYSIHLGTHLIDMPRVRDGDGLHFDLAGLARRTAAGAAEPAALRYMSSVAWADVVDAAFHLRPDASRELLLQIR